MNYADVSDTHSAKLKERQYRKPSMNGHFKTNVSPHHYDQVKEAPFLAAQQEELSKFLEPIPIQQPALETSHPD